MTNNMKMYNPPHSRRLTKDERMEAGENVLLVTGLLLASGIMTLAAFEWSRTPWERMWWLCAALFVMAKAAVLPEQSRAAFVVLWPGMDAVAFNRRAMEDIPLVYRGLVNGALGLTLIWAVARQVADPFAATWTAMVGFILAVHCGAFTLLAAFWRTRGRDVMPLMQAPLFAGSVTEFWGRRWNHAFRDVAHAILFKPVTRRFGAMAGMWAVFLVSGLAHELVISVPAGAGYGGPTAYFALQAVGLTLERGCPLKSGWIWRLRAWLFLLLPLPLLFHPPFVMNVCHPFFQTIGALP